MNYDDWERTVPPEIKADIAWKMRVYRIGLFSAELGWYDTTKLAADKRTRALADQLYRALGSISANIIEGYSRSSGRDRARFYEYALGSARESRDWYLKARHVLGEAATEHRIKLLTEVIRMMLTIIPKDRKIKLGEERCSYQSQHEDELLKDVPMVE